MDAKFTSHTLIVFMYSCFIVVVFCIYYTKMELIQIIFFRVKKKSNILTIILNLKHVNCIYNCMLNMYFVQKKVIIFFVVDIINMIWLIYYWKTTHTQELFRYHQIIICTNWSGARLMLKYAKIWCVNRLTFQIKRIQRKITKICLSEVRFLFGHSCLLIWFFKRMCLLQQLHCFQCHVTSGDQC